jgi:uncharacterized lipoprotein YbaY
VVLVRGTAKPNEGSIVATQVIPGPGATPIDYRLVYDTADIDPTVTYTVQAGILDGANAWTTAKGTKVITNGAPTSDVALVLAYRPDLVKGEVSGSITGVGITPSATAYSVAVLVDPSTGDSLGMDVQPTNGKVPVPFSVPFSLDGIDPARDYVVTGEISDGAQTWENTAGVPVITKGNAISDVEVVVTAVVAPSPSPSPAPGETGGGDATPAFLLVIVALVLGAIGLFLWSRSRNQPPPGEPGSPSATPPEEAAGSAEVDAEEAAGPTDSSPDAESPDAMSEDAESPDAESPDAEPTVETEEPASGNTDDTDAAPDPREEA